LQQDGTDALRGRPRDERLEGVTDLNDRRHVVVGLFVLIGVILLALMVVWFEGAAFMLRGGYDIRVHLSDAMGVRQGKRVHLDGIEIGQISDVYTSRPARPGVWVKLFVKKGVEIPLESVFEVQQTAVGDVYMDFKSADKVTGYLPTDGTAELEGASKPPALLPEGLIDDFRSAMRQLNGLGDVLANVKELTAQRTLTDVAAGKPKNLWTTLEQIENTAAALQLAVQDPGSEFNQLLASARDAAKDLRATLGKAGEAIDAAGSTFKNADKTLASIDAAAARAGKLMDAGNALAEKLTKDAEQFQTTIAGINTLVDGVNQGRGTLGKLVSSDELHRALVTLAENLQTMTDNTNRLMIMWREQGILSKEK
jgi:phospholipid/cholesterol/gamma-HCH transport system substrate-binding protein